MASDNIVYQLQVGLVPGPIAISADEAKKPTPIGHGWVIVAKNPTTVFAHGDQAFHLAIPFAFEVKTEPRKDHLLKASATSLLIVPLDVTEASKDWIRPGVSMMIRTAVEYIKKGVSPVAIHSPPFGVDDEDVMGISDIVLGDYDRLFGKGKR